MTPKPASAPVLTMPSPPDLRVAPASPHPTIQPWRTRAAIGGVALLLAAGLVYWRSAIPAKPVAPVRFTLRPPAGFAMEGAASRQSLTLSPDGSQLAFTAMDASGAFRLFLTDFASREPQQVADSEGAHTVFWPATGNSLYFTRLRQVLPQGNNQVPLPVGDAPAFMFSGDGLGEGRLLVDAYPASFTLDVGKGALQRLKEIYWWPQMLADGKHFLCQMVDATSGKRWARIVRTSDFAVVKNLFLSDSRVQFAPSTVTPDTGHLLYVRGSNLVARAFDPRSLTATGDPMPVAHGVYHFTATGAADFTVSRRGTIAYHQIASRTHLALVDRTGRELAVVGPARANLKAGRFSPDGKCVAMAIHEPEHGRQDVWIYEVQTGRGWRLSPDLALRDAPVWSPDGKRLAFTYSLDGRNPNVHIRGVGINDLETGAPEGGFQTPIDWRANGRFVGVMDTAIPNLDSENQADVASYDVTRGFQWTPLLNSKFHESWGAFSPDGKWLAFASNESGRGEVYVQALEM